MAGIGFELRKAIQQESVKGKASGYMGAAFSSSGSMIVGIVLFFFIQQAAEIKHVSQEIIEQFMCYVTNTMFFSMIVVSVFTLILSRYLSNSIYEEQYEKVMPSLIGATSLIAIAGGAIFAVFLFISKLTLAESSALLFLYLVLSSCWLLTSYVTLIRDYKWVAIAYLFAFLIDVMVLVSFCLFTAMNMIQMIIVLSIGFGVVDIVLFRAVYRAFPNQDNTFFTFFREFRSSPALGVVGLFMMIGMLGHFYITWFFSAESVIVAGLFCYDPAYDFPAIIAYFSTIPASTYFVTAFETSFSEKYQKYFYLLGNGGCLNELNSAKKDMIESIRIGIRKLSQIQILTCLLFITVGGKFLAVLNIGMTETMLDTFRIFCVGYSLYFIANILILLHLYFVNERKVIWSTLCFAILTTLSAYFNAKNWIGTYGSGFLLTCGLLIVVAGIQLVKYLSKLEYHVFCKQSAKIYSPVQNNTPRIHKTNQKKRIHYAIGMCTICLSAMILSFTVLVNRNIVAQNILTFTPKKTDAVLTSSPGMGLAPWAESEESMSLDTSLVYLELKWSDWEPEEGVYDIDFVNEYYNLDFYRQDGRKVIFRFICDEPTKEHHMDIPEWLYNQIEGDGTWYDIEYGTGFSPNYNNKFFIEKHAEAIAALGKYFGKDDFILYVELGSLGHWGEWHVDYENGITPIPEFAVREEYIKPYLNAFPNAMFLIRYPLVDAETYGFGLYNDMTGDYDETLYWQKQMLGGIWEQTNLNEQAVCTDVWKDHPIGGEFASTYEDSYFLITNFDLTIEAIKDSHQSFIGPKIIIDETETDYSQAINTICKTIGYRYYVEHVSIDFNDKESISITCSIHNEGIAPIYQMYSVKLSIIDEDGNEVWASEDVDMDLRKILPNESGSFICNANKDDFDDDAAYQLVISIQDDAEKAVVPLANEMEIEPNCYQIAEFTVK